MTSPHDPPSAARLVHACADAERSDEGRVVVIGNLDGVHRGHQAVLDHAATFLTRAGEAKARRELAVLTFEPHPAAVLGASAPSRLTRLARKVELLGRRGVALVVAQKFDAAFAALSPSAFVDRILVEALAARVVVVGHDFRFGAQRAGDLAVLREEGARKGFAVEVQPVVADARGPLSSTRVRSALASGDLVDVEAVLGRPHAVEGLVIAGARRGRTIGFPTANLGEVEEAFPAHGVYAVVTDVAGSATSERLSLARGVANVGLRPTVTGGGGHPSIEVHLFDLDEAHSDLYGQTLRVHFIARLREERRFSGLDALRAQITEDAARAREITAALEQPARGSWY